jgi:hypothetical protein
MTKKEHSRLAHRLALLLLLTCGLYAAHRHAPAASASLCLDCNGIYENCKVEQKSFFDSCTSTTTAQFRACYTNATQNRTSCRDTANMWDEPRRTEEIKKCDATYSTATASCESTLGSSTGQCTRDYEYGLMTFCPSVLNGCQSQWCGATPRPTKMPILE